jgi:hypothetical protein
MRWLPVWLLAISALWGAGPFAFNETRYVYSIDKSLEFSGEIRFDASGMEIDYGSPEVRKIVYDGARLKVFDAEGAMQQDIDLNEQPAMRLYMQFLLWLYRGDMDSLGSYFSVIEEGNELHLQPIAPTDKVVTSVRVVKEGGEVRFIKTSMSNHDEIAIRITR